MVRRAMFFDAHDVSPELNALDTNGFSLHCFRCKAHDGRAVSLVVAIESNQIPSNGSKVDFTQFKDDILIKKYGELTEQDMQSAIKLFKQQYLSQHPSPLV